MIRRHREIQRLVGATTANFEGMQAFQSEDRDQLPTKAREKGRRWQRRFSGGRKRFPGEKRETERNSVEEREGANA